MELFRRTIKIEDGLPKLNYSTRMVTIGSCFSDNIGEKLSESRFDVVSNPFGVVFNPISIAKLVNGEVHQNLIERDNYWFSWDANSSIHAENEDDLRNRLNNSVNDLSNAIHSNSTVFVTFGTSWIYELIAEDTVVANCHKMPAEHFRKRLLSVIEIVDTWKVILQKYPSVNWVFTVSPVRHWKDGVRENNVSKGVLHLAIHELLNEKNAFYFPAYEILMDELRDHRFYDRDYLHPNAEAIDYIWNRFRSTFFDEFTNGLISKVESLNALETHRVMFPNSNGADQLKRSLLKQRIEVQEMIDNAKK
ncbi:MAG: GSCFA domain-containing protein [Flavobacteriales bacterium]|nr:GSCFA domain-containing protein [Flavobacteriales bacterium]MCB9197968.1 GSCFA domain-containing protein [Flavobacteriales bacterium]